jgi:predicted metal-dependent peptidase
MFFAEVAGILEDCKPQRLVIVWCDAKVHRTDECDEPSDLNTIRHKGAPGGGGTSFIPVFDWMASEGIEPDALVYLTDGMGSFPAHSPKFPVIWGNISPPGSVQYPFGEVVDIPKQAA